MFKLAQRLVTQRLVVLEKGKSLENRCNGRLDGKTSRPFGVQYRILNESGYAVQSTRVQLDKDIYSLMQKELFLVMAILRLLKEE